MIKQLLRTILSYSIPKGLFLLFWLLMISSYCFSQVPAISSFSPVSGLPGSTVTISGSNFSAVPANNIVYFGQVRAQVVSAVAGTNGALTVKVPPSASYAELSVAVNGLMGHSRLAFIPVYRNGGSIFDTGSSFAPKVEFAVGDPGNGVASGVIAADFDGDGKPDMAVANSSSSQLLVFKNTGNVSSPFALTPTLYAPIGFRTNNVITADLNADGKIDVISSSFQGGPTHVLRNTSTTGNISFADAITTSFSVSILALQVADFDGDGRPDIAANGGVDNSVNVKLNTGTGDVISFGPELSFAAGNNNMDIAAGDIDGDGKTDLVASNYLGTSVSLLINTSTPGALSFAPKVDLKAGIMPMNVLLSDLDGDGRPDIIITNHPDFGRTNTGYVYRNTSTPGAASFAAVQEFFTDTFLSPPAVADMDGDGKPDLVVVDKTEHLGRIIRNRSTPGNIILEPHGQIETFHFPTNVAVADFNADTKPDIAVSNGGSPNTLSLMINTIDSLRPTVVSCTPEKAGAGTLVTLKGTHFSNVTAVIFENRAATSFTVVSPTTITAVVPITSSGSASVTTDHGTGNFFSFVFVPKPLITKVTFSNSGPVRTYTIKGIDLGNTSKVFIDGMPASSFTNPDDYTIVANGLDQTTEIITITTPGGTAEYSFLPLPKITGFSPKQAKTGAEVTITGSDFKQVSAVSFGGTAAASFVVNSPSSITAKVGPGTSGQVSVTTPGGKASATGFIYQALPVITSFSPAKATTNNGITIKGANFTGVTAVTVGGVASTFQVSSSTTIFVVVGTGSSGDIVVTTASGQAKISGFVFLPRPQVSSFSPKTARTNDVITIRGTGFNGINQVTFGGVPAKSFTVISDTEISAVVADGATGKIELSNEVSSTTTDLFTFIQFPAITSVSPLVGTTGSEVVINGAGFTGITSVAFGNTAAQSFKVISPEKITAIVGSGSTGDVEVGTATHKSLFAGFRYVPKPVISADGPATFPSGGKVTLSTAGTTGDFQWMKDDDGTLLGTSSIYEARESGSYTVVITVEGLVIKSAPFVVKSVFALPADNFKLAVENASCRGAKSGAVTVTALRELDYTATITGDGISKAVVFNKSLRIPDLGAGVYSVCITVAGQPEYKQCFSLKVGEPKALSVYATVNKVEKNLTLNLSGADAYEIRLNDVVYKTTENVMTIPLAAGNNKLSVSTGLPCQGTYEETLSLLENHTPYPNPFMDVLNVNLGEATVKNTLIKIIRLSDGQLVLKKSYLGHSGVVTLDVSQLTTGVYALQLSLDNVQSVYKIIRN
jgi:hypothetical protein